MACDEIHEAERHPRDVGVVVRCDLRRQYGDRMRGFVGDRMRDGKDLAVTDGPTSQSGRVEGPARELFLEMNGRRLEKSALGGEEEPESAADNFANIAAPTLQVVGELDFPHIIDRHEELSEELENAFSIIIEDTAHLPSLERPDLFDPLLLQFLEAISGAGEDFEDGGDDE